MLPDEFRRSSVVIFETLTRSIEQTHETDLVSDDFRDSVIKLLRGERGVQVQQVLADVSMVLERRNNLADLRNFTKNAIEHLRFYAFRVLDQYGQAGDATTVLKDRLLGKGGFVETANKDFQETKINVAHIASGRNSESGEYWRNRVKQLKYAMVDDLKYYTEAARFVIVSSGGTFESSASGVMNYALNARQTSEAQQEMLIKLRTTIQGLSSNDLALVNGRVLQEFMYEALQGTSEDTFAQRLHVFIDSLPHLKVFEDFYENLDDVSSKQLSDIQQVIKSFTTDIEETRNSCRWAIESMFNTMDYTNLPENLGVEKLVEPFMISTEAALGSIKLRIDIWLHALSENQKLLY